MWFNNIFGYNASFMNFGFPFMNYFQPYQNSFNYFGNIFQNNYFMGAGRNNQNSIFFNPFRMNYSQNNFYNLFNINHNHNNCYNNVTSNPINSRIDIDSYSDYEPIEDDTKLVHGAKYNQAKGERLAENILAGLPSNRDPKNPLCARYVKRAIVKSGLGPYINGNGEYCKYILRANDNFKEVNVSGKDLDYLPKGSIIVYDAGEECTDDSGKIYNIGEDGHATVVVNEGQACSDVLENTIYKTNNAHVFIPV